MTKKIPIADVMERARVIEEDQALALEFEVKAEKAITPIARWWYRRAARSIRKDLGDLYRD